MLGNLKHICLLYYLLSMHSVIFFSLIRQNKNLFSFILPILNYFPICPAVFILFSHFLEFFFCPIYFLHYANWNAKHTIFYHQMDDECEPQIFGILAQPYLGIAQTFAVSICAFSQIKWTLVSETMQNVVKNPVESVFTRIIKQKNKSSSLQLQIHKI